MLRYSVFSLTLVAFIIVLGHGFDGLSISDRAWPFLVVCGILCTLILVLAFFWDRMSRRRRSDDPGPPDSQR